MTYPRSRNGHTDVGAPLRGRTHGDTACPNCGSYEYRETVSREHCPKCDYTVDYWGGGSNSVAKEYMEGEAIRQKAEDEARFREMYRDMWGEEYNG